MSHRLFGNRFAEKQGNGRVRAWHNLGQVFPEGEFSAVQAVAQAGMGYKIGKFPVMVDLTATKTLPDGTVIRSKHERRIAVPDQFALIREPVAEDDQPRFFGTVGRNYTVIQNTTLAEMIDKMATGYTVETVGALGLGETVFFALAAGKWDIRGDEIEDYLLVTDTRDGKGGIVFYNTPVRVVCQNTLNMSLSNNSDRVSLTHRSAVKAEVNELLAIFNALKANREEQHEALRGLTGIKLDAETARALIETVYPEPEKPVKVRLAQSVNGGEDSPTLMKGLRAWESQVENVKVFRAKVEGLHDIFNDQHRQFAGTGYALFNAVTEHEDHYKRGRSERTRAEGAVFGDRSLLKQKAFALIDGLR
jgi:phage/plasmid-like protein (TIGR03299 family)